MAPLALLAFLLVTCPRIVLGAELALDEQIQALVDKNYLRLKDYYTDLHAHPELSRQEKRASENLSRELKEAGFEVNETLFNVVEGGGHIAMAKTAGLTALEFANSLYKLNPDIVLIRGDRF